MKTLLLFLLLSAPAQASVALIPVSPDNIAQVEDVLTVQRSVSGEQITLTITVTPPAGQVWLFADLSAAGWTGRLLPELQADGSVVLRVRTTSGESEAALLDIMLDNSDPARPAVGMLYRLSLASFAG